VTTKPMALLAPFPRTMEEIFDPADLQRLAGFADIAWARDEPPPTGWLDERLPEIWAYVGCHTPFPTERLRAAPALRAILEVGGSFPPGIDYAACFGRGIRVLSCAPAFGAQVAEMALALTLAACRGVVAAHLDVAAGREVWQGDRPTDFTLFGAAVGFIGFGAIARNLLPLLAPFRCRIRAYDPWLPASLIAQAGCEPVGLDELLATSRAVYVLAAPAPENRELIGRQQLAMMQPGALLLLVSRAHLIDFAALTEAVGQGRIQAAIDVFPEEPLPADDPIRGSANVVLSPHRAASIRRERQRIGRMVVDDLELMASGLAPVLMQAAEPEIIRRRIAAHGLATPAVDAEGGDPRRASAG
jgi:phosphoglycerate dehydrogenase-like enzyme